LPAGDHVLARLDEAGHGGDLRLIPVVPDQLAAQDEDVVQALVRRQLARQERDGAAEVGHERSEFGPDPGRRLRVDGHLAPPRESPFGNGTFGCSQREESISAKICTTAEQRGCPTHPRYELRRLSYPCSGRAGAGRSGRSGPWTLTDRGPPEVC